MADTLLPGLLGRIARSSPHLRLEIHVGRSPFLMESLQRGELDMTISTREDATLEGILLHRSPTVWLCATQFKPSPHEPLPLILIDEPSIFRRFALEALDRARLPRRLVDWPTPEALRASPSRGRRQWPGKAGSTASAGSFYISTMRKNIMNADVSGQGGRCGPACRALQINHLRAP